MLDSFNGIQEDAIGFDDSSPCFQLEDELVFKGGGDAMCMAACRGAPKAAHGLAQPEEAGG